MNPPVPPASSPRLTENVEEWRTYARAAVEYAISVDPSTVEINPTQFVHAIERNALRVTLHASTLEAAATRLSRVLNRPVAPPLIARAVGANSPGAALMALALLRCVGVMAISDELKGQLVPAGAMEALLHNVTQALLGPSPPVPPTSSPRLKENIGEWRTYARAALEYAISVDDDEVNSEQYVDDFERDTLRDILNVPTLEAAAELISTARNTPIAPCLIAWALGAHTPYAAILTVFLLNGVMVISDELKDLLVPTGVVEALVRNAADEYTGSVEEKEAMIQRICRSTGMPMPVPAAHGPFTPAPSAGQTT